MTQAASTAARLPTVPSASGITRILGATVIDGTGAEPLEAGEVEVTDGQITYVGPERPQGVHGATVVAANGGYLMPGFIDVHIHAAMPNDATPAEIALWFPEEEAFATAATLRLTLDAGVTTARDLAALTPGYRNSIAVGAIDGPRLHLAISMLSPTGGHADPLAPNGSLPVYAQRATTPGWAVVDTDEDVLTTIRRLDRIGADVIKVCTTGGLSSRFDSPSELGVSQQQVAVIVAEMKRRRHQPVTAHAQSVDGIAAAVRGGAASIEHGYGLTDELIGEMRQHGTALVPTLTVLNRKVAVEDSEAAARRQARREQALTSVRHAFEAEIPIALGTDAGLVRHGRNLAELGYLVDAGLTPLQAIHSGTLVGAELLGLDKYIGSIEVGKLADLVLTTVNPLDDIRRMADADAVRWICQSGRVVKDLDGIGGEKRGH